MVRELARSKIEAGKTEIPSDVREKLLLEEGEELVWMLDDNRIYVTSPRGARYDARLMAPHWLDYPRYKDGQNPPEK